MRTLVFAAALLAAPCFMASAAFAEPQNYILDPNHTEIGFTVDRFGFNHVLGRFDTISGEMVIDETAPEHSSVHAVVQTASYNSGSATRDGHLKSARWLNADQFPTMEFRSTAVHLTGPHHATVTGDLTLAGQTHPITLDVTLNNIGPSPAGGARIAGFTATGVVHRTQFGVAPNVPTTLIGDDVNITIEALAAPPQSAAPAPAATTPPAHN